MGKHFKGTEAEERALGAYVKLARAARAAMAYARVGLEEAGLTLGQFAVLEALYHVGPLPHGELARRILTSAGNLTTVIDNLELQGLAKRLKNPDDKRFAFASITPTGRRLMARIFPAHVRRITDVMGRLKPEDQEFLGELCRRLGTGK